VVRRPKENAARATPVLSHIDRSGTYRAGDAGGDEYGIAVRPPLDLALKLHTRTLGIISKAFLPPLPDGTAKNGFSTLQSCASRLCAV